jgi:hypothetical protein
MSKLGYLFIFILGICIGFCTSKDYIQSSYEKDLKSVTERLENTIKRIDRIEPYFSSFFNYPHKEQMQFKSVTPENGDQIRKDIFDSRGGASIEYYYFHNGKWIKVEPV